MRVSAIYSLAAGATSAIGSVLINVQFWQAAIIAGITGLLAATGTIIGAYIAARIAAREAASSRAILHDVKRKIGAAHRATDEP